MNPYILPYNEGKVITIQDLYSPNIVQAIKSRKLRWAGHIAQVGRREACIGFWRGNLRERDHWGDPGVGGRILLGWIFRKFDVGEWTGLGWLRKIQATGTCECGNEPWGSINAGNFLTSYKPVCFSRSFSQHVVFDNLYK
jgi:hypothetical protein